MSGVENVDTSAIRRLIVEKEVVGAAFAGLSVLLLDISNVDMNAPVLERLKGPPALSIVNITGSDRAASINRAFEARRLLKPVCDRLDELEVEVTSLKEALAEIHRWGLVEWSGDSVKPAEHKNVYQIVCSIEPHLQGFTPAYLKEKTV